jgi:hypothetical protein
MIIRPDGRADAHTGAYALSLGGVRPEGSIGQSVYEQEILRPASGGTQNDTGTVTLNEVKGLLVGNGHLVRSPARGGIRMNPFPLP